VNTLGFVDVPQPMMSSASSLSGMFTLLAQAGGIAGGTLILHGIEVARHSGPTPSLLDFHIAFVVAAAIVLTATVTMLSLPENAGADVSGYST
jgi:hypothetical protein